MISMQFTPGISQRLAQSGELTLVQFEREPKRCCDLCYRRGEEQRFVALSGNHVHCGQKFSGSAGVNCSPVVLCSRHASMVDGGNRMVVRALRNRIQERGWAKGLAP